MIEGENMKSLLMFVAIPMLLTNTAFSASGKTKSADRSPAATVAEYNGEVNAGQIIGMYQIKSSDGKLSGHIVDVVTGGAVAPDTHVICLIHEDLVMQGDDLITEKCFRISNFSSGVEKMSVTGGNGRYRIRYLSSAANSQGETSKARVNLDIVVGNSGEEKGSIKSMNSNIRYLKN